MSSFGTAVLLKFDPSYSLENCVRPVYYNTFPLTLYFQAQFIKVHCTAIAKNTIKSELKKESLSSRREKDLLAKNENIRVTQKRRKQTFKNGYHDKSKSIRQYPKEKYLMNRTSEISYQNVKHQENPEVQLAHEKCKYLEITEMKKDYQKMKYQSNPGIEEQ